MNGLIDSFNEKKFLKKLALLQYIYILNLLLMLSI
jgi:hypothetical protein